MSSGELLDSWLHPADAAVADRVAVATRRGDGWTDSTYAGLDRRSRSVAAWLADARVDPGDRVALLAEAGGDWTAAFLGILRRGALAVTLEAKLTAEEMAPLCERSGLAAAVVSPALAGRWHQAVPVLDSSADLAAQPADDASRSVPAEAPAVLVWTSGTTGEPKGVTLSFANLGYVVAQSNAVQGTAPGARWLSVLPPSHLLELCCGLLPALAAGSTTFVAGTVVPHELAAMAAECGIDHMVVVPLVLQLLKRHLEATGGTLPNVRSFYCGGAPLDPEVATFFDRLGIGVFQGYGLTEAAPAVSMNSPGDDRPGSVGRPLPGTEVRIAADGEILVRGPGIMLGYWHDEAATRQCVDGDGWLHTGDLGHLDGDGYLYVTGRAKSLIVLDSGKKVQPEEVEAALARSALFAEVCVVGLRAVHGRAGLRGPNAMGGEQVCAVVVPAVPMSPAEAEEEVARLTTGLSGYKRPTLVRVHSGELPRTVKRSLRRADVVRMLEGAEKAAVAP